MSDIIEIRVIGPKDMLKSEEAFGSGDFAKVQTCMIHRLLFILNLPTPAPGDPG